MGWLEGLLTGYAGTMGDIRRQNAADAERAAARESEVYKTLLSSEDPEIRGMAATGLLSNTQPKQLKSGFGGWMGQMQSNPMYPQLMKYINTPKQIGEDVTTTTTTPQQAGYLPTLPDTSQPAALPDTKTTTPGAPGPQPVQATPNAGPPPPPAGIAGLAPPSQVATPPPAINQVGPDQVRGALPPSASAPESLRQTTRTPIIGLPHAFPTTEESAIAASRAKDEGEYQSWVSIGRRAGQPNPERWAADQMVAEKIRRSGGTTPRSIAGQTTAPDGTIHQAFRIFDPAVQQYIDPVNRQPDPNFRPISAVGMGQYFERAAAQSGYGRGSMVPDWAVPAVQSLAEEMAQSEAGARTTGTREARAPMLPAEALTQARQLLPNATLDQVTQLADALMAGSHPAAATPPATPQAAPPAAAVAPPAQTPPVAAPAPTGPPGALSGPAEAPAPPPGMAPAAAPAAAAAATPVPASAAPVAKKVNGKWVIPVANPAAAASPAAAPPTAAAPPAAAPVAGATTPPPAPPAATPSTPTTFGAKVVAALPPGGGDQSKLTGKPLSPELEKLRAQTQATNDLIDSALKALDPFKADNTPEGSFNLVKNYRQGVYDPLNSVAAQLSDLAGLQAKNSAALSAGGTRAWQYVVQKSEHVPKMPSTSDAEKYGYLEHVPLMNENRAARVLGSISRLGAGEGHAGGFDTPQLMYHKLEQVKLNNENFLRELQKVTIPVPGVGQPPPKR